MKIPPIVMLLILVLTLLFVFMLDRNLDRIQSTEPTQQDDATAWESPDSLVKGPAIVEDCYGMDFDLEIIEELMFDWRGKQQDLCKNYSDIRIEFDGKEYLFSYDEFKDMLILHTRR